MLQGIHRISSVPWLDPLANSVGIKSSGLGMEAEPKPAHRAFFRRSSMSCPKCAGLLVVAPSPLYLLRDYYVDTYDLQDKRSGEVSCVNCGYYADAVMRARQAEVAR